MALLNFNPMAYTKYFALHAPMILAAFMILASAFNKDIKGLVFMIGAVFIMFIGQLFSSSLGREAPENAVKLACNMFSSSGWGYKWSSPGPNALFLSFVSTYLITGMAVHQNFNWGLMGILLVITLMNAGLRVKTLHCGTPIDILFGWVFGIIGAILWYGGMAMIESQHKTVSLTYFGDTDNGDKCRLTKKKFKCRKI